MSVMLMMFLASCNDDIGVRRNGNIIEGVPVRVSLKFDVGRSAVITREASSDEAENTVNSLYVFVFNGNGSLDTKSYFTPNETSGSGEIEMTVNSGSDKRIYAVANPMSGSGTLTKEQLDKVTQESDLDNITSRLLVSTNVERQYFLMSGQMEVAEGYTQIDIDNKDGKIIGSDGVIKLYRTDARITFKVKGANSNGDYSDFVFTPDRYWVENIPQGTYVFPQSQDLNAGYVSMSDESKTMVFEGEDKDGYNIFEFYIPENRLTPKQRIESSTDLEGAENRYALREKREKTTIPAEDLDPNKPGQTVENGAFKYANDNSTYVVFRGVLSYTDNSEGFPKFVNANVTYTVHLGNTGGVNDANDPTKVNDYNTERNTHYTYTVTITGITSMQVEVKSNKEQRPGIEGDVIIAGAEVKSMDSHYGRTHFTLRRGDIRNGLSWAISTPFQRGMKVFVADDHKTDDGTITKNLPEEKLAKLRTNLSLNDYKWVQFVVNKEAVKLKDGIPVGTNDYAKYPGYMAYDGGSGTDTPAPAFGGNGYHVSGAYYTNDVVLYDVNQLVNHLYIEANDSDSEIFEKSSSGNSDDDIVGITAFIDEYVYVYNPAYVYYNPPVSVGASSAVGIDLTLWKKVVNGSNRMLHFCKSGNIYSEDGNTSLAESVITISQKPIYTFYNTTDPNVKTAWGTESIMETGRLVVEGAQFTSKYLNESNNGRPNTLNIVNINSGPLKWTDVLGFDEDAFGHLNTKYNNIWYACVGRNRDLDGDNIVDEDEIRWYLASIDQLTDMWIGQNSLNEEAWLYKGDGTYRMHVASSTYHTNSSDNPWVIWAEEGASRGSYTDSKDYNPTDASGLHVYDYRCVRNLGLDLDDVGGDVDDYVTVSTGTYNNGQETFNEYIIDVSRLESNSIRWSVVSGDGVELPKHDERDGTNRPYKKFAVLRNRVYPSGSHDWYYYQDNFVCPPGYRTPNQREMMLMYTSLTAENGYQMDWAGTYMTYTSFSFNGNSLYQDEKKLPNRPGFLYNSPNFILETANIIWNYWEQKYNYNGKYAGYVRCVRDVTE